MMIQKSVVTASKAIEIAKKLNTVKCSVCTAIPCYCDCPRPKSPLTEISVRYSVIQLNIYATSMLLGYQFNIYATTSMLNDTRGIPLP